jgi:hypothetical protein
MDFFFKKKKKKKSLRQKSPAETKKEKDDVRKTNQGNKSKKERVNCWVAFSTTCKVFFLEKTFFFFKKKRNIKVCLKHGYHPTNIGTYTVYSISRGLDIL